jgi:hypothetical protein
MNELMNECVNDGRNSDGAIFGLLRLDHCLEMQRSALPDPAPLPSDDRSESFPHQIAVDEASQVRRIRYHTQDIFYPAKQNDVSAKGFLVVGKEQCVCAFGMLASNFRIFEGLSCCNQGTVEFVNTSQCSCSCLS